MDGHSGHSRSSSSSSVEPQINENSTDHILLKPPPLSLTACSEAEEDLSLGPSFARLRKKSRHYFWRNPCSLNIVIFVGDLLLTLAPCLFLIHSLLALSVNNYPVSSSLGQKVEQATKLAPTLFPVIFAAVAGRFMRTYALWRAERGASLGILELLNGSQNLLAAFERALFLPGLGFLSIVVMLLWTLSPVGGQSALRVLSRKILSTSNTTIVYYFDTTSTGDEAGAWTGAESVATFDNPINAILQASLTSLERVKGRDIWGNIKIPVLQYVPSYTAGQSEDGWYDFDENDYHSPYSSLTGLLVSGLNKTMETNIIIESSYFNLTCAEPVFLNLSDGSGNRKDWGGFATWVGTLANCRNDSSKLFAGRDSKDWTSYMIDTNYIYTPSTSAEPHYNIIYASRSGNVSEVAAYNCTIGVSHVENEVICSNDCYIKRIRPSHHGTWLDSGWPWPVSSWVPPFVLLQWLGTFSNQRRSGTTSPLDLYVRGLDNPYDSLDSNGGSINYRNVTGAEVAERLQSVINTAWQLGFQGSATAKRPEENKTALMLRANGEIPQALEGVGYPVRATNATTIEKHNVFMSEMLWIAVTVIVSFILLFCGSVSMIFKYGANSPDILGYVSSMTRDNPNFEQIHEGDKLDGLKTARVLRHLQVQIVDAKPWDADGYVTLKPLNRSKI